MIERICSVKVLVFETLKAFTVTVSKVRCALSTTTDLRAFLYEQFCKNNEAQISHELRTS